MPIRVALNHDTLYNFDRRVSLSPHVIRLRPAPHCRTPIRAYSLKVSPEQHFLNWQQDPFGNYLARLVFPEKTDKLHVKIEIIADMEAYNPFDFFIEEYAENFPFAYDNRLKEELGPYLKIEEAGPKLLSIIQEIDLQSQKTIDFLVDINRKVQSEIQYSIRMEPGVQSCERTLQRQVGSCRDSAWLLVQMFRHLGLAARFVSGYLIQLKPDEKSLDGPSGPEEDFTDLHAWTEVYIPGAGWVGLDPTSGLLAGEGHIPLACTPHPASAAPLEGATDPCEVDFIHRNQVKRIYEDPRVTKPYSEAQWQYILALGHKVDEALQENDVRLSMGGEPTFVSIDDMESAQWNLTADGEDKRRLSYDLLLRLRDSFSTGALLYFGQGKWYPGEALPRWSYSCFWRTDGQPIWQNQNLLANINKDYGFTNVEAEKFAIELSKNLKLPEKFVQEAYEDWLYYLWKEESIPINLKADEIDLNDAKDRKSLARVLKKGLAELAGYVLPLKWNFQNNGWQSMIWEFRRDKMYLLPGDSPMGYRLPLDSLPWISPEIRKVSHAFYEQSQFAKLSPLPDYRQQTQRSDAQFKANEISEIEAFNNQPEDIAHTALCVEARSGRIYVFIPPFGYLEHYLDLIHALEKTADTLNFPIIIEGYEAPKDWRLQKLSITPDPGVIEVNIHPAQSWEELVFNTTTLYEQARLVRLGTEKFMLDGRHTGTGGGNHITIGGLKPEDSPLLRKPDLLRSLITFWQHHPALSYLFSGMFIGPTSQAPRIDEARDDALFELEIAFQQLSQYGNQNPWMVDRILRNLLVDITGNTHRAEFCIDKLYDPINSNGRLGLLELRAFEMPPHAQMSLVQNLLLRTLVALFWEKPYHHELIRWGTSLHDRFLLPYFVRKDMKEVVKFLQKSGYPMQTDWFEPFMEFRFPRYGTVQIDDIQIELRFAIEPWHVLGEEVSSQGTARYVDSSVERLQIYVTGLTEGRHIITCNGRRIPLQHTARKDEYVAGIRYKAWHPPSALHPTIKSHSPLVFDIIDTWNGRSIGGCSYHVSHPGGRSYEDFPVNAITAETRRQSLFRNTEHSHGPLQLKANFRGLERFISSGISDKAYVDIEEEVLDEFPATLDLRYEK